MSKRIRNSEVDAYSFIKDNLVDIGWIKKNPLRHSDGQVFTQNECLSDEHIAEQLRTERPEYIVKLSETEYYPIEAKRDRVQIDQALEEAEYYADKINKSQHIKALIISGVAGNDSDGYLIKSKFLVNGKFKIITSNGKSLTSLVSPEIAKILLTSQKSNIDEVPISEKLFLASADKINVILHKGAIPADRRGKVISGLLLALIDETPPNLNASTTVLIDEINSRANAILHKEGKPEFYDYVRIQQPTTTDNHVKMKQALVKTIQELNTLNIRAAMKSGTDFLGKFYEVFLKYGNWAKELGIVFTPRHITRFASEVLDIQNTDIIYDPTCGTGGFLVSAFDYVKKNHPDKIGNFKKNNLFGIEFEPSIVALAIVNMIFRGDGKNNIKEADCFKRWLNLKRSGSVNTAEYLDSDQSDRNPPISKVLMNPPFALKTSDEKEYKFVDHALKQMHDEGLLFSILPVSSMIEQGEEKTWRENELLNKNTLLAVITFPPELFYPVAVNTLGIIIKKGIPHDPTQKVFWLRAINDGFIKKKKKRLRSTKEHDTLEEYAEKLKEFIHNGNTNFKDKPEEFCLKKIDYDDKLVELVPEAYLESHSPKNENIEKSVDQLVRETASYLIKYKKNTW
jgi:type I restriction enzyme M protein